MSVEFKDNSAEVIEAIRRAKERALERMGSEAEGYAKDLCPVDTGNLQNSINHKVSGDYVYIGTNVEYAAYVELGTSRQKAKPYLKPAVADHKQTFQNILSDEMKKA